MANEVKAAAGQRLLEAVGQVMYPDRSEVERARLLLGEVALQYDAVSRDPFIETAAPVDDAPTAALRELIAALSDDDGVTELIYGPHFSNEVQRIRMAISNAEHALGY